MPLPSRTSLSVYRGDSAGFVVRLWNDPEKTEATDLSGAEVRAQLRPEPDSTEVITEFEISVTGNAITLSLPPKLSAELDPKQVFDVQVTWDPPEATNVQTVLQGVLTAAPDVTRV